jgi:hypothetical protein
MPRWRGALDRRPGVARQLRVGASSPTASWQFLTADQRLDLHQGTGEVRDQPVMGYTLRLGKAGIMTALQHLQQTISRFMKGGRKRRQLKRELAQLAAMGELDALLTDVGLVRSQVQPLIAGSAAANERLDKMIDRLGIDVARLPIESLRDMAWTCMNCRAKRHCRQWLSDNKVPDFHSFCPNAAELDDALWKQHPELVSSTG